MNHINTTWSWLKHNIHGMRSRTVGFRSPRYGPHRFPTLVASHDRLWPRMVVDDLQKTWPCRNLDHRVEKSQFLVGYTFILLYSANLDLLPALPSGKHTKTIEHGPFIVDLPIKIVLFHCCVNVYQRVTLHALQVAVQNLGSFTLEGHTSDFSVFTMTCRKNQALDIHSEKSLLVL